MQLLTLNGHERAALEQFVGNSVAVKERSRGEAILAIADGRTVDEVADRLEVSRQTVYNWVHQFAKRRHEDPVTRLKMAAVGRPRKSQGVIEPILSITMSHDPRSLGYQTVFWSTSLLLRHLKQKHGIEVSRTSVSQAIHRIRPLRAGVDGTGFALAEEKFEAKTS